MFLWCLWFFDLLLGLRERFSNIFAHQPPKETQFRPVDLKVRSEDLQGSPEKLNLLDVTPGRECINQNK